MSRLRHVYPTDEMCHLWAHGIDRDIRNSTNNVYTIGDTIYSYGSHFPMAKRIVTRRGTVVFLLNPDTYSVTTSSHQAQVRSACSGNGKLIPLPVSLWSLVKHGGGGAKIREYFEHEIKKFMLNANNNRMGYWRRNEAIKCAVKLRRDFCDLTWVFHLRINRYIDTIQPPNLIESKRKQDERDEASNIRWEERSKKWEAEREKRDAEYKKKQDELRETLPKRMSAWREGEKVSTELFPHTMARVKGENIQTTMGVHVTLAEVRKFLVDVMPHLSKNGLRNDVKIGPYWGVILTDNNLIIGCHEFPWLEVARIKKEVLG